MAGESTTVLPDDRLLLRADENYRELFRALARVAPRGAVEEDADLLLAYSGPRLPMLNAAFVKHVPQDVGNLVLRATAFFGSRNQPWAYVSRDAVSEAITPAMRGENREAHVSPAMVLVPLDARPRPVPDLTIKAVGDEASLRVYNDTMTAGFGHEWASGEILASRALLEVPGLTHYVGFLEGTPVATAALFASHGIAGVFNVSTVPEYRRRGFGEALTRRASLDGRDQGCTAGALQASEMGEPIYRRMGYREVARYSVWLPA